MHRHDASILLHLSDLHFGWEGSQKERDERAVVLNSLLDKLASLDDEWKPNFVCITGDIGWKGSETDYKEAIKWVFKLLKILKLSSKSLFICPGNHDSDRRAAKGVPRAGSAQEADEALAPPIKPHFKAPFRRFVEFCKDLKVPPFFLAKEANYLTGQRSVRDLHVVCYNSSWFSRDDRDKDKLWLGLPFLRAMEVAKQVPLPDELDRFEPTIALLHHPQTWFHPDEMSVQPGRPNVFDYLVRRCHFLLTGHTHGEPRYADKFAEATWHLSGGAAFAGASHTNSFRLIRIEDPTFSYRIFKYEPESTDSVWQEMLIKSRKYELSFRPRENVQNLPKGTDFYSINWDMEVDRRAIDFDHHYSHLDFTAFIDAHGNYHGRYERNGIRVTKGSTDSFIIQTGASNRVQYEILNVKAKDKLGRSLRNEPIHEEKNQYKKIYQIFPRTELKKSEPFTIRWTFKWPSCAGNDVDSDIINLGIFKKGVAEVCHTLFFGFPVEDVQLWEINRGKCSRSNIAPQRLKPHRVRKVRGALTGYQYAAKKPDVDGYLLIWRRLVKKGKRLTKSVR